MDSFGDGWHGGYLEVGGERVCTEFDDGESESAQCDVGTVTVACDGEEPDSALSDIMVRSAQAHRCFALLECRFCCGGRAGRVWCDVMQRHLVRWRPLVLTALVPLAVLLSLDGHTFSIVWCHWSRHC